MSEEKKCELPEGVDIHTMHESRSEANSRRGNFFGLGTDNKIYRWEYGIWRLHA